MAKKVEEIVSYPEDIQKYLVRFLLSSEEAFVRCQNIIKPEYFTDRLRPAVKFIVGYAIENKVLPPFDLVNAKTGLDLDKVGGIASNHVTEFLSSIEVFCRHKSMEALIIEGVDLVEKGHYAEIERRSKENMMISLNKNLGTDYFADPLERLKRMQDRSGKISTGWKSIDAVLYGGVAKGELTLFAGPPNSGKSLFLQNIALNWVQMGLNVVYITLEMSEDAVSLRYDAMLSETPTKMIFKEIENIALKISMARMNGASKWGKLQLVKLPEAGTNANTIKAYLREYEIQSGIKPDALVVDYLDLIYPIDNRIDLSSLFIKDKYTSEELRALANELDLYLVTASQLNRGAIGESDLNQAHIAGGISKVNTADNVIAILRISELIQQGQYLLHFLKTRSSGGVDTKINLSYNTETMRILDLDDGSEPVQQPTAKSIVNKLNGREYSKKDEKKQPDRKHNVGEEPMTLSDTYLRLKNSKVKKDD